VRRTVPTDGRSSGLFASGGEVLFEKLAEGQWKAPLQAGGRFCNGQKGGFIVLAGEGASRNLLEQDVRFLFSAPV